VPEEEFRLGRDCEFSLNSTLLESVREVRTKRTTTEVDATGFGHPARSTVVTHRTYEFEVEVRDKADFDALADAEDDHDVVTITTSRGLREVTVNCTVCESDSDEPLDDGVVGRFTLKQWAHGA